ncbi:GntR family transcriptional regulator [Skermanella sp. TT6]|uniref:GntR family transcriptional regulator n=1 Tax=Skermanella cutis TaxID=2775420 RepID=A0ABX7BC64_9PROT|nr:GntR family transcriptional regulator [Skermanella sp. TT6]QQP91989.1 GntR family transcriptional regulator [Skermanella sp. TT6]
MKPISSQPVLIDQVYESLGKAIADGSLPAGSRIRQEELAERLGVSRQPVSHALQLLKRQGLLVESGKRGLTVAPLDSARILDLYQVRTSLDALAARLAAQRIAAGTAGPSARRELEDALQRGASLDPDRSAAVFIQADVEFHTAIYRLSGNTAIEETVAPQWPHLKRSMGVVLNDPGHRPKVWNEHAVIAGFILAGDAANAEAAALKHTNRAGTETSQRLAAINQAA